MFSFKRVTYLKNRFYTSNKRYIFKYTFNLLISFLEENSEPANATMTSDVKYLHTKYLCISNKFATPVISR